MFLEFITKTKRSAFYFPSLPPAGDTSRTMASTSVFCEMFLIASLFCFTFRCLTTLVLFSTLFLLPETIPSGVRYRPPRLRDERLNPGWESRGYADVEILKTHFLGNSFLFCCCLSVAYQHNSHTNCVIPFFFLLFLSRIEIICLGQLSPGDEKAEINAMLL